MRRHNNNKYHHRSSRRRTIISISPTTPVRLACLIVAVFFLYFVFFGNSRSGDKSEHRLAIVIPFIGQGHDAIPPYLELFCATAAGSVGLVDFLIFHDGVFDLAARTNQFSCPENVIFHSLESIEEFSKTLIRVVDRKPEDQLHFGGSREKLAEIVAKLIQHYPYVMVEFKPAFGHIFEEYLKGYTHWGVSTTAVSWETMLESLLLFSFSRTILYLTFILLFAFCCIYRRNLKHSIQIWT